MNVSGANMMESLSPDAFMKLFITQIQHQDPSQPLDPTAMMSQLAELTTVQQLDALNSNFGNILRAEQLGLARELIGSQVVYAADDEMRMGLVNSAALSDGVVGVFIGDDFIEIDRVAEILGSAN